MRKYQKFSELFNKYRLKAQIESLTKFGEALAKEGYVFEDSLFSRWKNSNRMPRNRNLILAIIKVFIKHKSLTNIDEANDFLRTLNQPSLTPQEQISLFNLYTYQSHETSPEITESDAFFLSQKILGLPFTTLHAHEIKQIFTHTKHAPHIYIAALQQIELTPQSITTILTKIRNTSLFIRDHAPHTTLLPYYIKKNLLPSFFLTHY